MKIKTKLYNILDVVLHVLPIAKDRIFFSSFHGQYNDNPKYISEQFHKKYPDVKQYWVLSEKSKMNDVPDYIHVLRYNTLSYCWLKNRCCVIVENGAGHYLFDTSTAMFELKKKVLKNRKQLDFSTWHGNPIKHIGAQIPGNEFWADDTFFTTSDMIIAGCGLVKNIFREAFLGKIPVYLFGTPRNDILFGTEEEKNSVKQKLKLPLNKKIILYAPTYRDNPEDSGIVQMKEFDFNKLLNALKNRFGGEWVFVFRVHNMVLLQIDLMELQNQYGGVIVNGNEYDDMAEYLCAADVLISDFSGCIYDIALTSKPCFLYAHDKQKYVESERGLYFPVSKFPYSFSESFDQLIENINKYDEKIVSKKRIEFLNFIENAEDGKATERSVDYISSYILKHFEPKTRKVK